MSGASGAEKSALARARMIRTIPQTRGVINMLAAAAGPKKPPIICRELPPFQAMALAVFTFRLIRMN
ncbi:hypothetical protein BN2497_9297 [Janthinobacterium sp. CG23_2]|nr:hypothetical protein BN2497_9297 [Janthinobacterium sp. CG23_2]CUU31046.1 hypothetical protein BN3177_9297 [Janthinobacterium sp. CG23_2]